MGKYIRQIVKLEKEMLLSEYLEKDESEIKCFLSKESDRIRRTKYLLEVLGDVYFDKETYILFIDRFQSFGGTYDVMTREDTIKSMYEITRKYKILTKRGIEEIWFRYIKDLFDEYSLMDVFEKCIKTFGEEDETFEMFMDYVSKKTQIHQQKYIEESLKISELKDQYSEGFISHLKRLIQGQHYSYEEIKKYLPSAELIKKDEEHIKEISSKSRIYFGCCEPVSYTMFDILLSKKTLDEFDEVISYYTSSGFKEEVTFTKSEFLESIQKQQKVLKRKK